MLPILLIWSVLPLLALGESLEVDCNMQVGNWSEWSECVHPWTGSCKGGGSQKRTREVEECAARKGEAREETQHCYNEDCNQTNLPIELVMVILFGWAVVILIIFTIGAMVLVKRHNAVITAQEQEMAGDYSQFSK
eukprot:GFUD01077069.1.p1 GENE.GFUD01077069.1~~GFUD01077069.1.p1  ORF type:complete len:136 (+),score=25.19 GFUD01077069.1:38-445(+)